MASAVPPGHAAGGQRLRGRAIFHLLLHVAVPLVVALAAFRPRWRLAAAVMLATMAVDLDHLLADTVFDPQRCSIGFHPLHRLFPVLSYALLCFVPPLRLVGLGLSIHMLLDGADCLDMPGGLDALKDFWRFP